MKYLNTITSYLSILIILFCCDSPVHETPAQVSTKLLVAGAWKIQSVQVDGVDQSLVYKDLVLNFSESSFTATNGNAVWPSSGSWSFTDSGAKIIKRGDNLVINLLEVSNIKLSISLSWNIKTLGGGKVGSVVGNHVFTFSH